MALKNFELRELWWHFLEYLENNNTQRRIIFTTLTLALLGSVSAIWVYPWWTQRNAIKMTRQWIASGKLNYAAETIQKAIATNPEQPEVWMLAAEIAALSNQKAMAVEYTHQAALASHYQLDYTLSWASTALRADKTADAQQALASLTEEQRFNSGFAQRLLGEIARKNADLPAATTHFTRSLTLDGPAATSEVPLGLCLLQSTSVDEQARGLALLSKWTQDREWGATALRLLLKDSVTKNKLQSMAQWAEALRLHPGCTVADLPDCLLALAKADPARFATVLASLEKDHRASPEAAAQLISWLNQIGQSTAAATWLKTLPAENLKSPPLVVPVAETWRQTADWSALQPLTEGTLWGEQLDFLRWSYGLQAARALHLDAKADSLWQTLYSHAQSNSAHGLFAASTLHTWGMISEAEALWWRVAEQNNANSFDALGCLARHYQLQRDAEGQYRVFNQLLARRPNDPDIANNFAFFAVLTGNRAPQALRIALDNVQKSPQNHAYIATLAFALLSSNRAAEALTYLQPFEALTATDPAIAFSYGLALTHTGGHEKARALLLALDPAKLTKQEVTLIKTALRLP